MKRDIWKRALSIICAVVMAMTSSGVMTLAEEMVCEDEVIEESISEETVEDELKEKSSEADVVEEKPIEIMDDSETIEESSFPDELTQLTEEEVDDDEELVGVGSYGVNLNSTGYATNINPFTAKGYYGQCTWYCWGRAYEKGVSLSWGNGSFGNAIDWYRNAAGNYVCDQTPSANSIMVSPDGGYYDSNGNYHQTGHVMFVEKVEGGYAYITEGNYNGQNYHEDWIQLSTGRRNWGSGAAFSITGYIHLPDGGNYLNLGDDFYANIAATGFDNWIFLENHGGNVQLWDKANDYSDTRLQWHFLRQQDGSYRIISMYDGRYLNADAMGSAGYNVSVYSYLDWEAQNWFILRNGNWYSFVPKYDTQICLDVTNAAVAGGTNIQLWNRSTGSEAQLFDIYKYDLEKYPLALNLGDDFYANIAATGFDNWIFLENHAGNVQLWDKQNDYTDTRLQWHFVRQQDGSYRIINMYDGRYLNALQMGSAGYNVCVYSYLDWEAQSWFIIRNGNWYSFVPKYDMQICLDVTNAAVVGGTNIQLWNRSDGSEAQLFDIYKFDYTPVNISGAEISFIDNYVYTGKPMEPSPDVKIGDLPLIYDKHYTVSYSNNTNVGRATVIITGTGAYTGTITKAFSITKATPGLYFASASLSKKTGDADFTNTLTKTTDGAVTFKSSNTSVATVNSTSGKVTIKGAGTVTITATAAEGTNYKSGSASYTLKVTASKTDVSGCTVTLSATSYTYNGQAKKPSVTVTNGSTTLVADTDYTVSYSNNTNAGTSTVTITGKGDYTGTNSTTFTIKQAAAKLTFANASISKTTKDAAFTNEMTKTTDGTVTFKSSNTGVATINSTSGLVTIKGAGTATITATASAGTNYKSGSASYTLTVTASKTDISGCTVTLSPTSYTYNGKARKPSVTVTNGTATLTVDTDYTVSYSNNTNVGTATVTVTGTGNCIGTNSTTFKINKAAPKLTFASESVSKTISDDAFINELTKTTDGTVALSSSDTNVATVNSTTGIVTIRGAGTVTITAAATAGKNYKAGSASYTLNVSGISLENAAVGGVSLSYGYSGKAYTPTVTVKVDGVTLTKDTDYTVKYENNMNPGTAKITVTGKGKYSGTKIKTFEIVDCVSSVVSGKTYLLIPKNNSKTAVCAYAGKMVNNTKIYITDRGNSESQKFKAVKNSDGTWKFINAKCELALAVQQNSSELGAGIVLYDQTTSPAQNWKLSKKSDNSFAIINSVTGYSIAMSDKSAVKGTTLSMAETASVGLQRFYIVETSAVSAPFDGTNSIRAAKDQSFAVNIASSSKEDGANVSLYTYTNSNARKFKIIYSGGGYYRMVNVNSGLCLTIKDNSDADGANVIQSKWKGYSSQRWKITNNSDGTVTITNMLGTVLHLLGNRTVNNTNIHARKAASTTAQKWYLN